MGARRTAQASEISGPFSLRSGGGGGLVAHRLVLQRGGRCGGGVIGGGLIYRGLGRCGAGICKAGKCRGGGGSVLLGWGGLGLLRLLCRHQGHQPLVLLGLPWLGRFHCTSPRGRRCELCRLRKKLIKVLSHLLPPLLPLLDGALVLHLTEVGGGGRGGRRPRAAAWRGRWRRHPHRRRRFVFWNVYLLDS